MRCLAKSPMDRFQAMDELLIALQDVSVPVRTIEAEPQLKTEASVPVIAPPTEEPEIALPPRSRGPSMVLVGGFLVAAVAGVLVTWAIVKPTAPTKLVFHVESVPAGASVMVEGKKLGVTPIDLEQVLGQGNRASLDLRLEKDGFVSSQVKLTGGGGRLEVSQTLTALPAARVVPQKLEETKKPEPVVVAKPEEAKVEPVKAPIVTKLEPVKKQPKPEPKKKATPAPPAPPPGAARPASKLDEEDESAAPARSELKRPTAQP